MSIESVKSHIFISFWRYIFNLGYVSVESVLDYIPRYHFTLYDWFYELVLCRKNRNNIKWKVTFLYLLALYLWVKHQIFPSLYSFISELGSCKGSHWKRLWCWEGLGVGGEGDDRGWDGWLASPTQWTWVWVNSVSWWWTGRPDMLWFMGSQRVEHHWVTELNWTERFSTWVITTLCSCFEMCTL